MNIEDKIDGLSDEIAQVSKIAAEIGKTKAALGARHWRLSAIILLVLLIISNGFWIAYASQFEKIVETTDTVTTTTTSPCTHSTTARTRACVHEQKVRF